MNELKLELGIRSLTHLKEKSCYNHNYYKIEPYGDGWCTYENDILLENCQEDYNCYNYELGHFDVKGEFVPVFGWSHDGESSAIQGMINKEE